MMDTVRGKLDFSRMSKRRMFVVVNLLFAVAAVIGQVGQNVSLPLWASAASSFDNPNCTVMNDSYTDPMNSSNSTSTPEMDPYFVLSSASFSFVIIFGFCTLFTLLVQFILNSFSSEKKYSFITLKDDVYFPQWQLILIGFFDAMNGVFVVFASPASRTAPFLQAILGNSLIPLTILFR